MDNVIPIEHFDGKSRKKEEVIPELPFSRMSVDFTGLVAGTEDPAKSILRIHAYDVSGESNTLFAGFHLTRAQWERLKEEGDERFRQHDSDLAMATHKTTEDPSSVRNMYHGEIGGCMLQPVDHFTSAIETRENPADDIVTIRCHTPRGDGSYWNYAGLMFTRKTLAGLMSVGASALAKLDRLREEKLRKARV
jgi:hypothetical protein